MSVTPDTSLRKPRRRAYAGARDVYVDKTAVVSFVTPHAAAPDQHIRQGCLRVHLGSLGGCAAGSWRNVADMQCLVGDCSHEPKPCKHVSLTAINAAP